MLERQEIDALLISALYGELTPTEETRLAAHLEAHPTDRTALAALTSTREAVRESRILTVQLDPPQSVSALLMQEAARRAPKPAEREGWFARLAKSFMMHPAMAAAAMLVVVLGVATFVNTRKDDIGKTSVPEYSQPAVANQVGSGSPTADQTIAAAGQSRTEEGAGKDSYQVGLAENAPAQDPTKNLDRQVASPESTADGKAVRRDEGAKLEREKASEEAPATKGKAKKTVATTTSPSGTYLELRGADQPQPKDLDTGVTNGRVYDYEDDLAKEQVNAVTPGPRGGYAPAPPTTTSTTAPKAEPKPDASRATVAQTPRGNTPGSPAPTNATTKVGSSSGAGNAGPARNQPSPPPAPPKVADSRAANATDKPRAAAPAENKSANDPQIAWAREQHTAIIARIRAGDCKGAANIAVVLSNRDIAYYKTNVATDRSVKECLAYIDAARERDAEQRAERSRATQKRANEPAPAKATSKPAASDASQFIK
ncbi:MAG: hypothetical protein H0T46_15605 [Deltaproteobacteria bacterium]|nr:hypothetical protein [Deltaproteobacteria bacterium]